MAVWIRARSTRCAALTAIDTTALANSAIAGRFNGYALLHRPTADPVVKKRARGVADVRAAAALVPLRHVR
jgi:hypothetical protein